MLDKLIDKSKKTDSRVWKWILGVAIAFTIALAAWWLKRRYAELQRLRAEKKLTEERQKDMELQVKNEEDAKLAKVLEEEADRLNTRIKERETDIIAKEREYEEAKKRIDDAKSWKKLEDEARS